MVQAVPAGPWARSRVRSNASRARSGGRSTSREMCGKARGFDMGGGSLVGCSLVDFDDAVIVFNE
jgi:hypothetical protein